MEIVDVGAPVYADQADQLIEQVGKLSTVLEQIRDRMPTPAATPAGTSTETFWATLIRNYEAAAIRAGVPAVTKGRCRPHGVRWCATCHPLKKPAGPAAEVKADPTAERELTTEEHMALCRLAFENLPTDTTITLSDVDSILTWVLPEYDRLRSRNALRVDLHDPFNRLGPGELVVHLPAGEGAVCLGVTFHDEPLPHKVVYQRNDDRIPAPDLRPIVMRRVNP